MSVTNAPSRSRLGKNFRRFAYRTDTLGFLLCVALVLVWPELDLKITSPLYDAERAGFFWKDSFAAIAIYKLTGVVGGILTVGLLVLIAGSFLLKMEFLVRHRKLFLFLFCSLLLGPGILVHKVLKDNCERPRPRQVEEFGGSREYEAPFALTFQCNKCRSFVSGHASVGFFFFVVPVLTRRRRWFLLPLIAGGVIGFVRIIQGGHFFSDILFCGWVVWFSTLLVHKLFYRNPAQPSPAPTAP